MDNREKPESTGNKQRLYYGYIIVITSFLILLSSYGIYLSYGVFFKPLLVEFGLNRATTSGVPSLNIVMQGLLGILMGRITDRFGPRIVLTFCGFLTGLAYVLMSLVGTVWQLYLVYGLILGIGLSGMMVPLMSTVARWFVKNRSMMTGIMLAGVGMGMFIMPPIVSRLISIYDWRTVYLIMGSIALVILVSSAQFLKRDPSKIKQTANSLDTNHKHRLEFWSEGLTFNEAIHTLQFWLAAALFFCLGFCRFQIAVHIVPHAIGLGMLANTAAGILATIGGLSIVTRPLVGNLADKIGNKQVFIIGLMLTSLVFFLLIPANMKWQLYIIAIIFSFNWGLNAAESPLIAWLFGLRSHGTILGITGLCYTIGASVGPLVAGYIFDTTNSYNTAFLICAVVSIIGLILCLLLKPIQGKKSI